MERTELIRALRRMKAETGSLVCLGCGHEHNCDIQGCAIIRAAAEELEKIYPLTTAQTAVPTREKIKMEANTIKVKVETEGLEEATEKIENLADTLDGFPVQVAFKNFKNCTINVYPSQVKVFEAKNKDD